MQRPYANSSEIGLQNKRRYFVAFVIISATLFLAAAVIETGTAASFTKLSSGKWLLRLDRNDAILENRLGQIYQESGDGEGVRHLQRATVLSPQNYRYHSHLAAACEARGDTACTDHEWQLLAKLLPMVPVYQFHAAQSYLRTNHADDALRYFRRLLELAPDYGPESWYALRPVLDPDVIFKRTISPNAPADLKLAYVSFLSNQGDDDSAFRIWRLVAAENGQFSFSSSEPYLERLLDLGRIGEAETVWSDLERIRVVPFPAKANPSNLIFNGDFQQVPLNAGFDWRWSDRNTYLGIDFSAPGSYRGTHCLRIDFTVNRNEEYEPVSQLIRVFPNRSYQLQAYVRSEQITSDSGPSLRVSDIQQASFPDVVSVATVGNTPWHPVQISFSTGADTQIIRLSVWRARGRTFPTEISGTFWMDAVTLRDTGPALVESASEQGQ